MCVGCHTNKRLPPQLAFDKYMSMGHVAVKFGRARRPSIAEWFLLEHGVKRRIEVVVQSFGMIPPVLLDTGRIATMPSRLVEHFAQTMPLQIVALPRSLPAFTEAVQWPAFHNNNPACIWMREILLEEASRMTPLPETTQSSRRP